MAALPFIMQELKGEVGGSQSYDVELIFRGTADDEGDVLPLSANQSRRIRDARLSLNILHEAPPDTDLDGYSAHEPDGGSTDDNSTWARTSLDAFLGLIADVPIAPVFCR